MGIEGEAVERGEVVEGWRCVERGRVVIYVVCMLVDRFLRVRVHEAATDVCEDRRGNRDAVVCTQQAEWQTSAQCIAVVAVCVMVPV